MRDTLRDLISARIDELGVPQAEYARRVGISAAHLNQILKGKIDLPRGDVRRRLADDLGITVLDMLVLAGELAPEDIPSQHANSLATPQSRLCARLRSIRLDRDNRYETLQGILRLWADQDARGG